jgi:virginiamycin B lyase
MIPSKNPNWGDCGQLKDCGISQVFDFTIDNKKIWFTEWVENNIGFIDTEKSLPFSIESDKQIIKIKKGESTELVLNVKYNSMSDYLDSEFLSAHTASNTINFSDIEISSLRESIQNTNEKIIVKIHASDNSLSGNYKVLVGIGNDEITVSKFINVTIES